MNDRPSHPGGGASSGPSSYLRTLVGRALGQEAPRVHAPAALRRQRQARERGEPAFELELETTTPASAPSMPSATSAGDDGTAGDDGGSFASASAHAEASRGHRTVARADAPRVPASADGGEIAAAVSAILHGGPLPSDQTRDAGRPAPSSSRSGWRDDGRREEATAAGPARAGIAARASVPEPGAARPSRAPDGRSSAHATPARTAAGARAPATGPEATPDVHIHIGRIELTAVAPPAASGARRASGPPPRKPMSLDEYLQRRRGGSFP